MLKQATEDDAQGALLDCLETVQSSEEMTGTLADLFGNEYADNMAKLDVYRTSLGLLADETGYAGSMQKE